MTFIANRPFAAIVGAVALFLTSPAYGQLPCDSGTITVQPGSELDLGWQGRGHDLELSAGHSIGFDVLRRCSDNQAACTTNGDCANSNCVATCNGDADTSCEIVGPQHQNRCHTTLAECTTNADCLPGNTCAAPFGPPTPISTLDTPLCVVNFFDSPLTGTVDSETGELSASMALRLRLFTGSSFAQPCPRCGTVASAPEVGQQFTCEGGQFPGASCTVDAVSPLFGGTSYDCPPTLASSLTGTGFAIRIAELTTGTSTRTAQLPCSSPTFNKNPLNPATMPKCTDKTGAGDPVCASNADCMRCSSSPATVCSSNTDCVGKGTCAEGPDQPVTCGYWCHCGFCNNELELPCFENIDCPDGKTCIAGTGGSTARNAPQIKPNDCSQDAFICGTAEPEKCTNTKSGRCSGQAYRGCEINADCENFGAGSCVIDGRPCFGSRITRDGEPSAFGSYCAIDRTSCTNNADCTATGDVCVPNASAPDVTGLFCSQASSASFINTAVGITGPGALDLKAFVELSVCGVGSGCGNGALDSGEQCDDGNLLAGDCCSSTCTFESTSVVCRAAAGVCDLAESCSGSSGACPDNAFQPPATPCASDENPCTTDQCNNSGGCTHPANSLACDDGSFCNGVDTCAGGTCSLHAGDPCPGADDDSDCSETCSETTDDCTLDDDDGSECDDGNAGTTGDQCTEGECAGTTGAICGDADANGSVQATDALRVLKAAVGQPVSCALNRCDTDNNGLVQASDALKVLKKAVGQSIVLTCPA